MFLFFPISFASGDFLGILGQVAEQRRFKMHRLLLAGLAAALVSSPLQAQQAAVARGEHDFRACAPCHSLETDRNMTGPSLANLWGRKAGGLPSFDRYSDALKASGIIWDDRSLDAWLTDPEDMVPDNAMPFNGIKDPHARGDLLIFLKQATNPDTAPQTMAQSGGAGMKGGGMMGMMGGGHDHDLKTLAPDKHVTGITHCRDTYRVTTADGKTRAFWDHNLRFMTDAGKEGPQTGAPAIMPAGMMGDRAAVIFAAPEEISKMIEGRC
jgi:cytochrome c